MRRILILGGTIEARRVAEELAGHCDLEVITSLAGRTDHPIRPPGTLRIGGFGGADGLAAYLRSAGIDRLLDATHPFARRISANARWASAATGVPLLVMSRPGWRAGEHDRWLYADSVAGAARIVADLPPQSVLLTIGRGSLERFAGIERHDFVIRSVDPPTAPLPPRHRIVLARGPFAVADELDLMRTYRVGTLVTKNSGGTAAAAKLEAARAVGATVVIVERPPDPPDPGGIEVTVTSVAEAVRQLVAPAVGGREAWRRGV